MNGLGRLRGKERIERIANFLADEKLVKVFVKQINQKLKFQKQKRSHRQRLNTLERRVPPKIRAGIKSCLGGFVLAKLFFILQVLLEEEELLEKAACEVSKKI